MNNNLKVSIIMSAYNAEKYIAESIESILNQSFKDFEFIIFDDGSTDDTKKIIRTYAKKDNRIIPVYNNKNIGYIGFIRNLNKGMNMAKCKYIARMDADDISLPKRLEKQLDYLENNNDIFLIGTSVNIVDENGIIIRKNVFYIDPEKMLPIKNCIYHPTIMFRNDNSITYREKILYCEDYDLYLRLITLNKKIVNLKETLLNYRVIEQSVSRTKAALQQFYSEEAKTLYLERKKIGHDNYDSFNSDKVELDIFSKKCLLIEIKSCSYINNYIEVNRLCKSYFINHGFNSNIFLYYLLSLLPQKIINFIKCFK
ncbi:MAG: glycosyltransferase [Candidatus Falkowbacteria bacterium]